MTDKQNHKVTNPLHISTPYMCIGCDLLVAGRVSFAATQGNTDDTARKRHVEAVRVFVHVQREDALVILMVRQAPGNGSEKPDQASV